METAPIRRTTVDLPTQTVDQPDTTTTITSPSPGATVGYGNESQMSFDVTVSGPQSPIRFPPIRSTCTPVLHISARPSWVEEARGRRAGVAT